MRKSTKKFILKISLIGYVITLVLGLWFRHSDMTSNTDLLSKYGIFVGIPALVSFLIFLWYVAKIMLGKKVD